MGKFIGNVKNDFKTTVQLSRPKGLNPQAVCSSANGLFY